MGAIYQRKYAEAATLDFCLYELDGTDLVATAAYAAGDVKIMKDEGAEANTTNSFTDEGTGYSLVLTATEMTAARVVLYIIDQTSPKIWLDRCLVIETYGHASAQHAFDLDTATQNVNVASIDNIDFGATMKASLETAVDAGLDNAVPAVNTAGSVNDLLKDQIDVVLDNIHDTDLPDLHTDVADIHTDVGTAITNIGDVHATDLPALKTVVDNIHDTDLPAVLTAVTAVQNNTRFTAAVPAYLSKPDAGNEAYRISSNLYDTVGNMEDPDNAEVIIRLVKDDGTFITATLYKENGLANALDNATNLVTFPAADGWRALERDAAGKFFCFVKVANDAAEESLTVEFGWEEAAVAIYQTRSAEIADVNGDLSAILADTMAIVADTNELQTDLHDGGRLDLLIDATLADTNELQTDWVNGGRLDLILDLIKTNTDDLLTDVAVVDLDVVNAKAVTDLLTLAAIADAVLDEVVDANNPANANTFRKVINVMSAALAGKASGGGTANIKYRDLGDTKDRIDETVDADGNRTAVTLTGA